MQIKKDGITRLVVLPLYPQFSISTSGSSLRLLERIFRYHKQEARHLEYLFGKEFLSYLQIYKGHLSSGVGKSLLALLFGREDEYLVNMQHTVIPSWYSRDGYVQSMATLIEKELMKFEKPEEVRTHYKDLVLLNICDIDFRASINKCRQQILFAL